MNVEVIISTHKLGSCAFNHLSVGIVFRMNQKFVLKRFLRRRFRCHAKLISDVEIRGTTRSHQTLDFYFIDYAIMLKLHFIISAINNSNVLPSGGQSESVAKLL